MVVGENRDEPGADSNGAGKTSLVAAPLWALTGDVLARTEVGEGRGGAGGGGVYVPEPNKSQESRNCWWRLAGERGDARRR